MDDELTYSARLGKLRRVIIRLLNTGAVLLFVFLVAVSLALILSAAGDDAGTAGVLGIVYVAGVGLLLDAVGLVIVSAVTVAALAGQHTQKPLEQPASAQEDQPPA